MPLDSFPHCNVDLTGSFGSKKKIIEIVATGVGREPFTNLHGCPRVAALYR